MPLTEINYLQVNIGFSTTSKDGTTTHFGPETSRGFIERVENAMAEYCLFIEVHTGNGSWDGKGERSAHLSSYRFREPLYRDMIIGLEDELRRLAVVYGQASIALITGSELLEPLY